MSKPKILLQLDSDAQPSVFDSVVAIDSGVEHLLRHGGVTLDRVRDLVFGAIFTRGPDDLHRTAIFVGGSDVGFGEAIVEQVTKTFLGPLRVSVMMDSGGANTTAAAAVLAIARHVAIVDSRALVLGATGPVGRRVVRLLARGGAEVRVGSRSLERSQQARREVLAHVPGARLEPVETGTTDRIAHALDDMQIVVGAGAAGIELLSADSRIHSKTLRVAVDLNAVPPAGLAGIEATDHGKERGGILCYGAIGVGGMKMKIHKQAIRQLFESKDQVLDAEEIFEIGRQLTG